MPERKFKSHLNPEKPYSDWVRSMPLEKYNRWRTEQIAKYEEAGLGHDEAVELQGFVEMPFDGIAIDRDRFNELSRKAIDGWVLDYLNLKGEETA